jgi:hypothetical protein
LYSPFDATDALPPMTYHFFLRVKRYRPASSHWMAIWYVWFDRFYIDFFFFLFTHDTGQQVDDAITNLAFPNLSNITGNVTVSTLLLYICVFLMSLLLAVCLQCPPQINSAGSLETLSWPKFSRVGGSITVRRVKLIFRVQLSALCM